MITPELLIIASLAVYRLTYMLNAENGPADIFGRLRARLGVKYDQYSVAQGTNWISEGILCFFCLSVWIGIAMSLLVWLAWRTDNTIAALFVLLPFALSGAATFMKRWAG